MFSRVVGPPGNMKMCFCVLFRGGCDHIGNKTKHFVWLLVVCEFQSCVQWSPAQSTILKLESASHPPLGSAESEALVVFVVFARSLRSLVKTNKTNV